MNRCVVAVAIAALGLAPRNAAAQAPPAAPPPPAPGAMPPPPAEPQGSGGPRPRLALAAELAFGATNPPFVNGLVGPRVDLAFPGRFHLGLGAAYANLKGPNGRAHNVLPHVLLQHALRLTRSTELPLRFVSGYLPNNGPYLKLAAGLSFALGETTRLGFDVLAPAFWVTENQTVVSFNLAAEVAFGP